MTGKTEEAIKESVDEFGDSYVDEVTPDELRTVYRIMAND
jgi:hypothetical protein